MVGLDADGETDLYDLEAAVGPLVVVVGSEGRGLSRLVGRDLRPAGEHPDGVRRRVAERLRGGRRHARRGRPPPRRLIPRARGRSQRAGRASPRSVSIAHVTCEAGHPPRPRRSNGARARRRPRHVQHGGDPALAGRPDPPAALRRPAGHAVRRAASTTRAACTSAATPSAWRRPIRPRYEPNPKRRIDEPAVLLGDREVPTVDLLAAVLARRGPRGGRGGRASCHRPC